MHITRRRYSWQLVQIDAVGGGLRARHIDSQAAKHQAQLRVALDGEADGAQVELVLARFDVVAEVRLEPAHVGRVVELISHRRRMHLALEDVEGVEEGGGPRAQFGARDVARGSLDVLEGVYGA